MKNGFTITEFAAAIFIGLPLLILGIQMIPGLMKSSDMGTKAGLSTMFLRSAWDDIRTEARTISGFDIDYTQTALAFASPYDRYKLNVIDSTTSDFKTVSLSVWYDKDADNSYDAQEIGYSITGYLTRTSW